MRLIILISFGFLLLFGCSSYNNISVGTFNLEWLGDGIDDINFRNESDYSHIREVIKTLNVDILALQEVENKFAVQKIVDTNKYNIIISTYPEKQKTALIINKDIEILDQTELSSISLGNNGLRPGLVAYCKYNGIDFFVGSFHLKSTSRYDDTPEKKLRSYEMRKEQSEKLLEDVRKLESQKNDKDFILLGDFNDNPTKKNSNISALENDEFDFLTSGLNSCKFPIWKSIDHIIVTKELEKRVISSSLFMMDVNKMYTESSVKKISDHCPVIVSFNFGN